MSTSLQWFWSLPLFVVLWRQLFGSTVPTCFHAICHVFPTWTQVAPAAPCKQRLLKFRRPSSKAWNGPCGPRRLGRQPRLGRPAVSVKMKNGMDVGYILLAVGHDYDCCHVNINPQKWKYYWNSGKLLVICSISFSGFFYWMFISYWIFFIVICDAEQGLFIITRPEFHGWTRILTVNDMDLYVGPNWLKTHKTS